MFDEYRKRIDRERRRFEAVRALVKHRRPDMTPVARGNVLTHARRRYDEAVGDIIEAARGAHAKNVADWMELHQAYSHERWARFRATFGAGGAVDAFQKWVETRSFDDLNRDYLGMDNWARSALDVIWPSLPVPSMIDHPEEYAAYGAFEHKMVEREYEATKHITDKESELRAAGEEVETLDTLAQDERTWEMIETPMGLRNPIQEAEEFSAAELRQADDDAHEIGQELVSRGDGSVVPGGVTFE